MSGAIPMSIIGAGYVVPRSSPLVLVKPFLGEFHVCQRVTHKETWAEIIAVFKVEMHANDFAKTLKAGGPS